MAHAYTPGLRVTERTQILKERRLPLKGKVVVAKGTEVAAEDVVASTELPDEIRNDLALYSGCMAGASQVSELQDMLISNGFEQISITPKDESKEFIKDWAPGRGVEEYVLSATIEAVKPGGCCSGSCCS